MALIDIVCILTAIGLVWQFLVRPMVIKGEGSDGCSCGCSQCHYAKKCKKLQ